MTSFQTPAQLFPMNPFAMEPQTPRNAREIASISRRVLGNIENLCAPSLSSSLAVRGGTAPASFSKSQSPHFQAALKRMRDGSALTRLKQESNLDSRKHEEAIQRIRALSTNVEANNKGLSNPHVKLGKSPERRSGLARSA